MLNQVIIVGRLVSAPITKGDKIKITVAVPRTYKNMDGEIETDFIDCELWNGIAKSAEEYLNKGDLVGIKGRLENIKETEDSLVKTTKIIAEKITFLSSKKPEDENTGE